MKHAREDYNRIQDPAGNIPADEPVFLIRGSRHVPFWLAIMNFFRHFGGR